MELHLGVTAEHPDVQTALAKCAPHPIELDGGRFTDAYRHPSKCLKLLRTSCGLGALDKGSPEIDDALQALGRESLARICGRVPDIARLAALVWELHAGDVPKEGAPEAPPPAATQRRTRRRKERGKR